MEPTKRERESMEKKWDAQKKRNAKKRLSHIEEQLLRQFTDDPRTVKNELQRTICNRLENLGYLWALGPDTFDLATEGRNYLLDHNLRQE